MTATEELRRMLDERGVEWDVLQGFEGGEMTRWRDSMGRYVTACDDGVVTFFADFYWGPTPEQAIEATLGRGTCRIAVQDNLAETDGMGDVWLECDACHWQMPLEPSTPRFNYCPNCGREVVE